MSRRTAERGVTLAELLVALAILLVAITGALSLYDATWKSFKQGECAAEQQQGLRIAFEKIGLDLQMAGFNFNPDGHTGRPDEQIEGAWATAVVIRSDFDGALEPALAGGAFEVVSTGNDEVVVYALAKEDGTGPDTLSFVADLAEAPRNGTLDTVQIQDLALAQDAPPYTLYRITLNPNTSTWGTPAFAEREVLARNIGSLGFRYYDDAGVEVGPVGGGEAAADDRARIARIEVDILGLAPGPRPGWVDPGDANPATREFRKFSLAANVHPRNLGLKPEPDDGSLPPG